MKNWILIIALINFPSFFYGQDKLGFEDNYAIEFKTEAIVYKGDCDCSFPKKSKCIMLKIDIEEVLFAVDDDSYYTTEEIMENIKFLIIDEEYLFDVIGKDTYTAYVNNSSIEYLLKYNRKAPNEVENDTRIAFGYADCKRNRKQKKLKKKLTDLIDLNRLID
ncbi:MAG: hypothetical protein KTR13_05880 [Saprospiraceae bacterium]|nr:hypothetical protein [Saprospiraceae bacterium]